MSIAAGALNRRIYVQERAAGKDSLNNPNGAWGTVLTLWSQPKGMNGLGAIRAAEGDAPIDVERVSFRVRYRPTGLNDKQRIVIATSGDIFSVIAVKHDHQDREWTDIIAEKGANSG